MKSHANRLSSRLGTRAYLIALLVLVLATPVFATELPPISPSAFPDIDGQIVGLGNKCLDVLQSNSDDGTPIVLFQCTGNLNQIWRFTQLFDDSYEIRGLSGKCLQPGPVGPSGFPELVIGPCGGAEDRWLVNGSIPFDFNLVHAQTGQCADVLQSNTANLTPIILFECRGTANQDWRFEPDPNTPPTCFPNATSVCLNGERFRVSVTWRAFQGETGSGQVVPFGADDSGLFWFFAPDNWELLIKVIAGCPVNNRYWVFAAATTNVEYTITVTDTQTGASKQYFNPLGRSAPAITDTEAFATCP